MSIPAEARSVVLRSYSDPRALSVERVPVPTPKAGEVLIKIEAASINPSDLVFLRNQYGVQKPLPIVPGFEGSGTVVETGPGVLARWLKGKRVACRASERGNGTWSDYMVCPAAHCIPLLGSVTTEQGASLIVNPLTAWSLLALARREGHRAFIQTAAASALGRMLVRYAADEGVPAIHIVRRPEQAEMLRAIGAEHVIDSSQAGYTEALEKLSNELNATIAFDAVGGELAASVLHAMPRGSRLVLYGVLSGQPLQAYGGDIIFGGKSVGGFWLTKWVQYMSVPAKLRMIFSVQKRIGTDFKTEVRARYPLEKIHEAMEEYKSRRSEGKVLLIP